MTEIDVREEAIRRARRMGDPAAVSAAIAVIRARDEDEARGRELGERLVEAGLLSEAQFGGLLGIPIAARAEPQRVASASECAALQPEPSFAAAAATEGRPAAVAVLEAEALLQALPEPVPRRAATPVEAASTEGPSFAVAAATEGKPAHSLGAGVRPEPAPPRLRRVQHLAAGIAGVILALMTWRWIVPQEAASAPPASPAEAAVPAKAGPPPTYLPKGFPLPAVPLPPPAPRRAPAWAPRLRQVRAGDSSAVQDALRRIGEQLRADPVVSLEARQAISAGHRARRDRVVAWVELSLSRYPAVAGLRGTQTVEVAWAGE